MCNVKVKDIICFFSHANEHYPISDLYLYKYQQKERGYQELAKELLVEEKIVEGDKKFVEAVNDIQKYGPLRYFLLPDNKKIIILKNGIF